MNNYTILKKITKGASSEIFLAKSFKKKSLVCIKLISIDKTKWIRAKREIAILKQLMHPFIIHLHLAFVHRQSIALVFDYVAGGDLSQFLKARKSYLEEQLVWNWFNQLSQALSYLHANKILHRDIKTQVNFSH